MVRSVVQNKTVCIPLGTWFCKLEGVIAGRAEDPVSRSGTDSVGRGTARPAPFGSWVAGRTSKDSFTTSLAKAFKVDPEPDPGLAPPTPVFRLRMPFQGFGRLAFLVTSWVGTGTAMSVFAEGQLDEQPKLKLFAYLWKLDFVMLKE